MMDIATIQDSTDTSQVSNGVLANNNLMKSTPPIITEEFAINIELCQIKYEINDSPISTFLYGISTFGKKQSMMNKLNGQIVIENGLCLINCKIITINAKIDTIAMIDTGASNSFIGKDFLNKVGIAAHGHGSLPEVHGFEKFPNDGYAFVDLQVPDLHEEYFQLAPLIDINLDKKPFKVILGNDFLKHIKFERDGSAGTFTLSI